MLRKTIIPRPDWAKKIESRGFGFHSTDIPYWDESVCYEFNMQQINFIEKATAELWEMCLGAIQFVIDTKQYGKFGIPEWIIPYIEKSWNDDAPAIYGRFDFAYKNGQLKMLEFNADTPTSLYESGIVQWDWLKDTNPTADQFNSVHDKLIDYWSTLKPFLSDGKLHFTCVKKSLEDLTTVEYMRDCAIQAGFDTKLVFIDDIGWKEQAFVDLEDCDIKNIFKLYPWEWLVNEEFGKNILSDKNNAKWIEPAYKMILSNKAILPILYHLYPDSPYLLKSYFDQGDLTNYVKKPILSREGANIEIVRDGAVLEKTSGGYGEEGFVYQELCELPKFISGEKTHYALIGSWIIGQEPAGICIREADSLITSNTSRFIPHLITG